MSYQHRYGQSFGPLAQFVPMYSSQLPSSPSTQLDYSYTDGTRTADTSLYGSPPMRPHWPLPLKPQGAILGFGPPQQLAPAGFFNPALLVPAARPLPQIPVAAPQRAPRARRSPLAGEEILVRLPLEHGQGDDRSRSLWRREAAQGRPVRLPAPIETTSGDPHPDEIPQRGLPPTIDIFLPGLLGWQDLLDNFRAHKLARGDAIDDLVRGIRGRD